MRIRVDLNSHFCDYSMSYDNRSYFDVEHIFADTISCIARKFYVHILVIEK